METKKGSEVNGRKEWEETVKKRRWEEKKK